MGTSEKNLTWIWPLISIEWIPEILGSLNTIIEPTWIGLQKTMTTNVLHKSFGNRIFSQLKSFLIQTRLVENRGRYISSCVNPTYHAVRDHLFNYYKESSQPWSNFYRLVSEMKTELHFESLQLHPPKEWPEISAYSIFKQWSGFFQFIGLGFSLASDHFIPDSAITSDMRSDVRFIERCLKVSSDPRLLTGSFSLHTEADFLAWTKGEDYLPISDDSEIIPRIPHELIANHYEDSEDEIGEWSLLLSKATAGWHNSIQEQLLDYPFSNLSECVFSCKNLIDYFLFGRPVYLTNYLDLDNLQKIKNKWISVKNFHMSNGTWQILPNLFKDITRLCWGISYFRNSLKRPTRSDLKFNENIFLQKDLDKVKQIPIRCSRSKRTIYAILRTLTLLYKSLLRLATNDTRRHYELETKKLNSMITDYLPSNRLDRAELLREIEALIELNPHKKLSISNLSEMDIVSGYPQSELLQMCFWVHRYHEFGENSSLISIISVRDRLETLKRRLIAEIKQFQNGLERWDTACANLGEKVRLRRPI